MWLVLRFRRNIDNSVPTLLSWPDLHFLPWICCDFPLVSAGLASTFLFLATLFANCNLICRAFFPSPEYWRLNYWYNWWLNCRVGEYLRYSIERHSHRRYSLFVSFECILEKFSANLINGMYLYMKYIKKQKIQPLHVSVSYLRYIFKVCSPTLLNRLVRLKYELGKHNLFRRHTVSPMPPSFIVTFLCNVPMFGSIRAPHCWTPSFWYPWLCAEKVSFLLSAVASAAAAAAATVLVDATFRMSRSLPPTSRFRSWRSVTWPPPSGHLVPSANRTLPVAVAVQALLDLARLSAVPTAVAASVATNDLHCDGLTDLYVISPVALTSMAFPRPATQQILVLAKPCPDESKKDGHFDPDRVWHRAWPGRRRSAKRDFREG